MHLATTLNELLPYSSIMAKGSNLVDETPSGRPNRHPKSSALFDLSNFDINAVLRGMQLTLVGAHRALQNPAMFTSDHYKQAAYAVAIGIAIRLVVSIPIALVRFAIWLLSLFISLDSVTWDDSLINGMGFMAEYVLQIPFFLMVLMRYMVPTLDNLFMQSLHWVDLTYTQKHKHDDQGQLRGLYYPNFSQYGEPTANKPKPTDAWAAAYTFLSRFGRKALLSVSVFALSHVPLIGKFVLPAASFYTFNKAVGTGPAVVIFGAGVFLPRRYLVMFLQTYFSSRSLMRELLVPYFSRVHFTKDEKRNWFRNREGVLFGFGLGFYILTRVPLVGYQKPGSTPNISRYGGTSTKYSVCR
ncbi:hypothetical protein LMH87_005784 [Akanthomyces muscarius]|uniref:Transmembrane protein UsgS n=1 Tax=Akanthomyces muscarius TaxID=2231603 RepID=A0A9W8QMH6_AKAMU|nr:hypothetical protein LMH87_005784 [Akanthomyces muscarius]KAJ4164098.1 hypothetical protein LMH87_005784 [Akanthomyces muscarius]